MKLIRSDGKTFLFHIGKREKRLLFTVLGCYPVVPASYHHISKGQGATAKDAQELLETDLAEHKRANRAQLEALLNEPGRFNEVNSGYRFALAPDQMDWLLQVFNDIRIGSWLRLGCPEGYEIPLALSEKAAALYWAMDMAGYFETQLLQAMSGENPQR